MKLSLRVIALAFAGGAIGTWARFGVGVWANDNLTTLFVVNLLGAAALGWFNGDKRFFSESARAFWSVGFAGGFTTMSGVAVWMVANNTFAFGATGIVVAMLGLGIFTYLGGMALGKRFSS